MGSPVSLNTIVTVLGGLSTVLWSSTESSINPVGASNSRGVDVNGR